MAGCTFIPNEAIALAWGDPLFMGAVLHLYAHADRRRWRSFEAARPWLQKAWGVSWRRADKICAALEAEDLIEWTRGIKGGSSAQILVKKPALSLQKAGKNLGKNSGKAAGNQNALPLGIVEDSGQGGGQELGQDLGHKYHSHPTPTTQQDPPIVPQGTPTPTPTPTPTKAPKKPASKRATAAARRLSMAQSVEVSPELAGLTGWAEAWGDYCEMRQSKAATSWTVGRQVQGTLKKLLKAHNESCDPVLALQASFENSWRGVFPENYRRTGAPGSAQSGSSVSTLGSSQRGQGSASQQAEQAWEACIRHAGSLTSNKAVARAMSSHPDGVILRALKASGGIRRIAGANSFQLSKEIRPAFLSAYQQQVTA